ncbi:MAG: NAD-dependent epimerase/dehydratase family protein [Pyrinomonadaceae bacterium]|nr:NAD-dependent epimerase/dehydratase family protein [Sphingobacteriaceae bacterium]
MSFISDIQTISILGCGWYGFPLGKFLTQQGYKVQGSSTSSSKQVQFEEAGISAFKVLFEADTELYDPDFFNCQLLIISIPPKRSSAEAPLYTQKIERIKKAILKSTVRQVIFISSTSVYGDHNQYVDETTITNPVILSAKSMLAAENILKDQSAFELTVLRFGGLYGPGRDSANFFAGKKEIPNGKAPVNMLHLSDSINLTFRIIEKRAFGYIFNACSPSHPEKMDFYTQAALAAGLEIPQFIPELNEWKIVLCKNAKVVLDYRWIKI